METGENGKRMLDQRSSRPPSLPHFQPFPPPPFSFYHSSLPLSYHSNIPSLPLSFPSLYAFLLPICPFVTLLPLLYFFFLSPI